MHITQLISTRLIGLKQKRSLVLTDVELFANHDDVIRRRRQPEISVQYGNVAARCQRPLMWAVLSVGRKVVVEDKGTSFDAFISWANAVVACPQPHRGVIVEELPTWWLARVNADPVIRKRIAVLEVDSDFVSTACRWGAAQT